MNLVLLLTKTNRAHIERFIQKAAELQEGDVNGGIVLAHPKKASAEEMKDLIKPLAAKFKKASLLPISANTEKPNEVQLAAAFSRFLLNAYGLFPGPWLVVDGESEPTQKDFMQKALRQHNAAGGKMTGKCVGGPGWLVPVGPVVMSLPAKTLKFLHFITNQSWRRRGQYHFARCGFVNVEPAEYLFSIAHAEVASPELITSKVEIRQVSPVSAKPLPREEPLIPHRQPHQGNQNEHVSAEANREFLMQGMDDVKPINVGTLPGKEKDNLDDMDDKSLIELAAHVTGKKPHHFTKRPGLIKAIREASVIKS